MKFLKGYFEDEQTLAEWQDKTDNYLDYLERHKNYFSEDKSYTITYLKVSKFSLESLIEFGYGIEDILIEECLITESGYAHELVFVGDRSWCIACKDIVMQVN